MAGELRHTYLLYFMLILSVELMLHINRQAVTNVSTPKHYVFANRFTDANLKTYDAGFLHRLSSNQIKPTTLNANLRTSRDTSSQILDQDVNIYDILNHKTKRQEALNQTIKLVHLIKEDYEIEENSMINLLIQIVRIHLENCDLVLVVDEKFKRSRVTEVISHLPNQKQVIHLNAPADLEKVIWISTNCLGSVFLISDPTSLMEFANEHPKSWNYDAKVLIAGLDEIQLKALIQPQYAKLKKTEHIIGIVGDFQPGHFKIYMNTLYWDGDLQHIDNWRSQRFTKEADLFPDKISDLRNKVLKVITFEYPPNVMYHRDENGTLINRYGFDVYVPETLTTVFNFTIQYIEPPPGQLWGRLQSNGTFSGMVGMISNDEGDLAVANIFNTATSRRNEFQEFSTPYAKEEGCALARTEPPLPRWQSLGLPFRLNTWIAIILGLVLVGPVLFILDKTSTVSGSEQESLQQSIAESLLYVFGVQFRQPQSMVPIQSSTQLFVMFLWLYAIIITTGYSSNLTAFLTVTREPQSINTFEELFKSNLKIYTLGPFFGNNMAQSGNKYLQGLAKRYSVSSFNDAQPDILAGKSVLMNSRRYLEFAKARMASAQGHQRARIMKECFAPQNVGMAYQTNSPLKTKFDIAILWLVESGHVRRSLLLSFNKYQQLKKKREEQRGGGKNSKVEGIAAEGDNVIPLGIDHLQGMFIILFFGHLISLTVFFMEWWF